MRNIYYQEKIINEKISALENYIAQVEHLNIKLDFCEQGEEEYVEKEIDQIHYKFNSSIVELYLLLLNYFETQNSNELLKIFKKDLEHILNPTYVGISVVIDDDFGQTYYICNELYSINKFLLSFEAFDKRINKDIGLIYLENILSHTSYIIRELDIKPLNETTVYNSVKHVIKATFPDYIGLSEPFYKEAKCYKPDILIPSLNVAVEYKYATDEARLIKTIEDILIDVLGYSNHPVYKIFYAVFYVRAGVCTQQRFNILWNGYKFPEHWKPIFVNGE